MTAIGRRETTTMRGAIPFVSLRLCPVARTAPGCLPARHQRRRLDTGLVATALRLVAAALFLCGAGGAAHAALVITVDKASQQMTVSRDGALLYTWPVSTGRSGYDTPSGSFKPSSMERKHFSREWDDAPMPNSIFFTPEGHAIHGTYEPRRLGRAASHGCVRLSRKNAETLYDLVAAAGLESTEVVITGPDLGHLVVAGSVRTPAGIGVELGPSWTPYFAPIAIAPEAAGPMTDVR